MFSKRVLIRLGESCRVRNWAPARLFTTNEKEEKHSHQRTYEKTINQVTLLGRVGNDPLKKGTTEHTAVIFSLATHNNYKYETGEYKEKTDWHKICVFKPSLQELAYSYLRKGMRVYVTGKIGYGSVIDNGVTKNMTSIIADDIIFLHHDGSG
ncbi:single-stranded DNA-binding protein, mitochondrial [Halyomorpha halys]|uniref:single-stranded DNA-binding protein, mitochondrial n=1 Tax=Halyomorpha halys TaxID=286706 RepID=UPI0034D229A9